MTDKKSIVYAGQNVSYLDKTKHSNYVYTERHRPIPPDGNTIYLMELTMIMNKLYHRQLRAALVEGTFLEMFQVWQAGVQKHQIILTLGYLLSD